jgi:prepilin-type N-terminal cleavage/methylation domain-containing protein/prepilin-type processing-associated H-X9-DG protein
MFRSNAARRNARRDAFTLVELLVVITIIAILASILFPVFAVAREKGRQATCLSNCRQIGMATLQYVQDSDERFPFAWGQGPVWIAALDPYMKVGTRNPNVPVNQDGAWATGGGALTHCPTDTQGLNISYSCNGLVAGANPDWGVPGFFDDSITLAAVNSPANLIWMGDSNKNWYGAFADTPTDWIRPELDMNPPADATSEEAVSYFRAWLTRDYTDGTPGVFPWDCPDGPWACKGPAYRHHRIGRNTGHANFVFVDGHAKTYRFGQVKVENFFPHL